MVFGKFGVERHGAQFTGQQDHSDSTPMDVRRDAFKATALVYRAREDAARRAARGTVGFVSIGPGLVTAFRGWREISLTQHVLDTEVLADMLKSAKETSSRVAGEVGVTVEQERLCQIEPIPFDKALIGLAEEAMNEVVGRSHRLPSGPLYDA